MDFDLTQKMTSADKARNARTLRSMKQQVSHERTLKLDAFHEVDKLINQVRLVHGVGSLVVYENKKDLVSEVQTAVS